MLLICVFVIRFVGLLGMRRRCFTSGAALPVVMPVRDSKGESLDKDISLPARSYVRVAFILGDGSSLTEIIGLWGVFYRTCVGLHYPFRLYTVASDGDSLRTAEGVAHQVGLWNEECATPSCVSRARTQVDGGFSRMDAACC